jgi:glycine hydroxymethyltransferase
LTEEDFTKVAEFFERSVNIALTVKDQTGSKIKDYRAALASGPEGYPELVQLKKDVTEFSRKFPTIGF